MFLAAVLLVGCGGEESPGVVSGGGQDAGTASADAGPPAADAGGADLGAPESAGAEASQAARDVSPASPDLRPANLECTTAAPEGKYRVTFAEDGTASAYAETTIMGVKFTGEAKNVPRNEADDTYRRMPVWFWANWNGKRGQWIFSVDRYQVPPLVRSAWAELDGPSRNWTDGICK